MYRESILVSPRFLLFMTHAVLVVEDPTRYDYASIIGAVLQKERGFSSSLDVYITTPIEGSVELNYVLFSLFNEIRSQATVLGWDHTFQIDVFFNTTDFCKQSWTRIYQPSLERDNSRFSLNSLKPVLIQSERPALDLELIKKHLNGPPVRFHHYETAAVGGTFDHIHDGHKILVLMTIFATSKRLIVGITGPELLKNKKFSEMLELYELRQAKLVKYIQKHISGNTRIETFEINDVCGPTGYIKGIDALVVSRESAKGGDFVNKYRKEHGFPELGIVTINVIGGDGNPDNNWKGKLSSTDIRQKELEKRRS